MAFNSSSDEEKIKKEILVDKVDHDDEDRKSVVSQKSEFKDQFMVLDPRYEKVIHDDKPI